MGTGTLLGDGCGCSCCGDVGGTDTDRGADSDIGADAGFDAAADNVLGK